MLLRLAGLSGRTSMTCSPSYLDLISRASPRGVSAKRSPRTSQIRCDETFSPSPPPDSLRTDLSVPK